MLKNCFRFALALMLALGASYPVFSQLDDDETIGATDEQTQIEPSAYNKLRVSLDFGYSYRIAQVSPDIDPIFENYISELKAGKNISANLSYFPGKKYGLCALYSRFLTSNSMNGITLYNTSTRAIYGTGSMSDDIAISMYGVGLASRSVYMAGDLWLVGNFVVGMATYSDEGTIPGLTADSSVATIPIKLEGSTFGLTGMFGIDYKISQNLALGADISYLIGTINDITVNGEASPVNAKESLNRFDFNIGLRYFY